MKAQLTSRVTDWREGRRLRAWELHQQGWSQKAIAAALGVTAGAVSQWFTRATEGGVAALRRQPPPGATPKLSHEQRTQLPGLLSQGATHYGFVGDVWTQPRVAEVIRREFGVRYHPSHVGRLLKALGWSRQCPIQRATQRDEAAIQRWRDETWPRLKKKPTTKVVLSSS
jgi:transposase